MKTNDILLRDPFVLAENGQYLMYGTRSETAFAREAFGFDVYTSSDLNEWEGPHEVFRRPEGFWADHNFWAPEVHRWRGAYYMFATFASGKTEMGTAILRADQPEGPFRPWSDRMVTPPAWRCLDGTFYVSAKGQPYIVFSHEWTQIRDGAICAAPLTEDLKCAAGEPFLLFNASQGQPAVCPYRDSNWVTDGPFLMRTEDGQLHMLWSSMGEGHTYIQALAHSDNQEIDGHWTVDPELLFDRDGGHGMVFRTFGGQYMLTLHQPNRSGFEHPVFMPVFCNDGRLSAYCP